MHSNQIYLNYLRSMYHSPCPASFHIALTEGLGEDVSQHVLRAAMIPFGNIKSIDIPMDYKVGKTRGFAFVEFDDPDDGMLGPSIVRVSFFVNRY